MILILTTPFLSYNLDHGSLGVDNCVCSINVSSCSSLKTVAYLMINLLKFVFIYVILLILYIFAVSVILIMCYFQPFPLQTSSLFGGPLSSSTPATLGPVGVGSAPRNVNIHIHAGK